MPTGWRSSGRRKTVARRGAEPLAPRLASKSACRGRGQLADAHAHRQQHAADGHDGHDVEAGERQLALRVRPLLNARRRAVALLSRRCCTSRRRHEQERDQRCDREQRRKAASHPSSCLVHLELLPCPAAAPHSPHPWNDPFFWEPSYRPEAGLAPLTAPASSRPALPLPCNGKALPANAQWTKASASPCLHRIFVHSAPPELGVQLHKGSADAPTATVPTLTGPGSGAD